MTDPIPPTVDEGMREGTIQAIYAALAAGDPSAWLERIATIATDAALNPSGPIASALAARERERDEADRRAGAAERKHADGLDTRLRADEWKRNRKAERGYRHEVSFDRVWADTCALADRALTAEAENATLRASAERMEADHAEEIARLKAAGRILDGVEHNGMPEVRA